MPHNLRRLCNVAEQVALLANDYEGQSNISSCFTIFNYCAHNNRLHLPLTRSLSQFCQQIFFRPALSQPAYLDSSHYYSVFNALPSHYVIDVRSDTLSLPTSEMRQAMFAATLGDDIYREDLNVLKLEQKAAELFEKDAGLFVPSGTMSNLLAIMAHCPQRGAEAIVGDLSHTFLYEQGSAAQIAGVQLATIQNKTDGTFCLEEMQRKIRPYDDSLQPVTSLVMVENTHNMCGGKALPLQWLDELAAICKTKENTNGKNIALHMDGARVFNAAEHLNESVARITREFDSVSYSVSKALLAPVGSMLVGSETFIAEARRLRLALGGSMHQCGILAAAAIDNLRSPNFSVDLHNVHSNILLIHMANPQITASNFAKRLSLVTERELNDNIIVDEKEKGKQGIQLKVSSRNWPFVRIVLYNQIADKEVDYIIKKIEYVIREYDGICESL
uniref:Aromatic amino acid beta-eliminating lyase/threonine aldolase domain-containing protein n=1 Tax=Glossina palpalis gambiensis TaxID=67801 RepID=A0A1B0B3E4_9MUSC